VFSVETNAAEIAEALERYLSAVPRVVFGTLQSWTAIAADRVRQKAPVDTGSLAASCNGEATQAADGPVATIVAAKDYAPPVEFGSAEHEVTPKRGKYLRFPHRDGGWCFMTSVTIPAQDPQPFFFGTINDALPELGGLAEESLGGLADQVGLGGIGR
jgi:hypothetical protein